MSVSGDLPQDIIDSLQDKGVPYISRNWKLVFVLTRDNACAVEDGKGACLF